MYRKLLIQKWENKHAALLEEYNNSSNSESVLSLMRREMSMILDVITDIKSLHDPKDVDYLIDDIRSKIGIELTREQAIFRLNESPYKYGLAMGTEDIINDVCRDICGMTVPTYGDRGEWKKVFWDKLNIEANKKGYKVIVY